VRTALSTCPYSSTVAKSMPLPALGNPANLHKAVALTEKEFRFGFGNTLTEEESAELFRKWAIPSPARRFSKPR